MRWNSRTSQNGGNIGQSQYSLARSGRNGSLFGRMVRVSRPANDNRPLDDGRVVWRLVVHSIIVVTLLALAASRLFDII